MLLAEEVSRSFGELSPPLFFLGFSFSGSALGASSSVSAVGEPNMIERQRRPAAYNRS